MAQPKNLYRSNLSSLQSMKNLGKQPIPSSNPRFINLDNKNAIYRNVLRRSFGNLIYRTKDGDGYAMDPTINPATTPFRIVMNAGDINGTTNTPVSSVALPKPSNQVKVGASLKGLKRLAGSVDLFKDNDNSSDPVGSFYSGNPKFVYDGADYTRFKKLQAINRNYRDVTFGGDQYNASQQAYRRTHS